MIWYFVQLLRYVKAIEPFLDEERLLADLGMNEKQIQKVMEVYNNDNILLQ